MGVKRKETRQNKVESEVANSTVELWLGRTYFVNMLASSMALQASQPTL